MAAPSLAASAGRSRRCPPARVQAPRLRLKTSRGGCDTCRHWRPAFVLRPLAAVRHVQTLVRTVRASKSSLEEAAASAGHSRTYTSAQHPRQARGNPKARAGF